MRNIINICGVFILVAVVGCQSNAPSSRIVRLKSDKDQWRFSVNANIETKTGTNGDLTNWLTHLCLKHGDIIILDNVPDLNGQEETRKWLSSCIDTDNVPIYIYSGIKETEIFSVPIYHWVAPFDNPRNLEKSNYFFEGKYLGCGMDGYKQMVREIQRNHKLQIFILGSLYDINRGFDPLETPYQDYEQLLRDVLNKDNEGLPIVETVFCLS